MSILWIWTSSFKNAKSIFFFPSESLLFLIVSLQNYLMTLACWDSYPVESYRTLPGGTCANTRTPEKQEKSVLSRTKSWMTLWLPPCSLGLFPLGDASLHDLRTLKWLCRKQILQGLWSLQRTPAPVTCWDVWKEPWARAIQLKQSWIYDQDKLYHIMFAVLSC